MDLRSQTALLAAIFALALAMAMLLRPARPRVLTLFSVFSLSISAFYLSEFLWTVSQANFWIRTSIFFGSAIPFTALAFFMEFLGVSPKSARRARPLAFLGFVGGAIVALTPLADMPAATLVMALWVMGALTVSLSLLLRRLSQTESRIERARLRYLLIGGAIAVLAASLDFLPRFGIGFVPTGAVTSTLYLFFLSQTLQRLRLLDLHELLGKVAALSGLALILMVIYGALTFWIGDRISLFLFNTLVASFVILILIDPLRTKVEEWVVATLFRERFEMMRALLALRERVATVIDVREMARIILEALNETRRVTHASIYLLADDRPGFWLLEHVGPAPTAFLDAAAARGLVSAALRGEKAVLLENIERRLADLRSEQTENRRNREDQKRLLDLKASLAQMHAGITVPLIGGDRVIGFFNLWDERVPEAYASDEIALVLEIAERIGTVVENSKLYERMKERDRLAALGEMAAGLAHEIRNPLGAIKGAAQFLDPKSLPGDNGEFLGVIVEEVNRLNSVVSQFLDYSRPMKQNFAPTDLTDVVQRTLKLLQSDSVPEKVQVKLELGEKLPKVQADAEQLKQVLINLILNAVQAMPEGGTLTISARTPDEVAPWRLSDTNDLLELRIRDTGQGIPGEALQHIFVPFYTTKEKGTGLGLAICQRIVKNHGGSIIVNSKVGEGTEFLIRLPAIPEPRIVPVPENGTPSPDLTPYPGTLAPPVEVTRKPTRREKRKKRASS